jgi:hypothetical protein
VRAIADHDARFVGCNLLFLDGGTRDHFMRFLAQDYPALSDEYDRLYASKYAPKDYAARVKKTVGMLKARYGLADRRRRSTDADEHADDRREQETNALQDPTSASTEREIEQGAFSF